MMNVVLTAASSSECSSGCESGWTLYLEHSNNNSNFSVGNGKKITSFGKKQQKGTPFCHDQDHQLGKKIHNNGKYFCDEYEDVEDEDLSMVSDASSGPPHFDHDIDYDEEEEEVFCYGGRKKQTPQQHHHHHQCFKAEDFSLDDTASSKKNGGGNKGSSLKSMMDYSSQGFSATHFHQGRSNFQEEYGFIQPTYSTKPFQHNQWC